MSQSRSRKVQSSGGENSSRARSSVVKESGDVAHSVHHQNQPKTKQNSRTKKEILPKSIRYDLDNALVSLCDVWFDDIKPHLVRNKIKLHVDNSGPTTTTASGDCRRMRTDAPGCSHHDPGSGSDHRQRTPANSAAFSPTPRKASKVRFVRQPTFRLQSLIHSRLGANTQNKNKQIKSPKGPRKEVQPQSPQPPVVVDRTRLCRSCQPSDLSTRTKKRRVHTAPSPHTRDRLFTLLQKHKKCQTNITWVHYQSTYYSTVNPASYTVFPKKKNVSVSKNMKPREKQRQIWETKSPYSEIQNPVKLLTIESSHTKKLSSTTVTSTNQRPTSPEVLEELTKKAPVQTVTIDPVRDRHRSRTKKPNADSIKCRKKTGERKVDPSIAPQPHDTEYKSNSQFSRCFATTNFNEAKSKECMKNRKISDTDCNVIFDQDLIDIIGTKNDKRIRVLYHSPIREESNSVLNLLPSPNQHITEVRSKRQNVPWR